jgi:SAM-dependent methyltransferase
MNSKDAIEFLLKNYNFTTVLDVGSGGGEHSEIFTNNNKQVDCVDLGNSLYFKRKKDDKNIIKQNFLEFATNKKYDLVWCSHILEHQKNVGVFLTKCYDLLSENGLLCITVPPMKKNIVGGHLTLWNMGLLLYNLVINGIDCSNSRGKCYGYNISVIVEKKALININNLNLSYDIGDLEILKPYFPFEIKQNDSGDIKSFNWD